MNTDPINHWKNKIQWFLDTCFGDFDQIDGQPMEFEWQNFPRFTTVGILEEIQNMMICELQCETEQFKGRIIFMSMYRDINWSKDETETCQANAH